MNQIDLFKKTYKIMSVITAVTVLLLLLCFMLSFDASSGYFSNSIFTVIFFAAYIVGILVSLSAIFIPSEFDLLDTPNEIGKNHRSYFVCSGIASILIGVFSLLLRNSVIDLKTILYASIGLISFGIYLIIVAVKGAGFGIIKLLFLLFSILLPFSVGIGNNNNYYHHINSIENTLTVFFAIAFLAFILQEAKRIITGTHSNWHFVSMLLTYMSSLSVSVAYMIAFIFDSVNEGYRFYQMTMILLVGISVMLKINHFVGSLTPHSKHPDAKANTEETK